MRYIVCIIVGYLMGCINLAYVIGRARGFDIRKEGSKNAGASNAAVTMGMKMGILVGASDVLKAFFAAYIAKTLFPDFELAVAISSVAAVLGHMYPFWMGFKGGKGSACFMGMILAMNWRLFLAFGLAIVVITIITDYIAVATNTIAVTFPIYLFITSLQWIVPAIIFIATAFILFKHRVNLVRIIKGEEIGLRQTLGRK